VPSDHLGLEIIVMSRERPRELTRALKALEKVNFGANTRIRVSDNPSIPEKAIAYLSPNIAHTIRDPSGPSLWHLNQIISEATYEWTLITHDDDEILPILGELFQKYRDDLRVSLISGMSRILGESGQDVSNDKYEERLRIAGLKTNCSQIKTQLDEMLFDLGSLFPASAMIIRSSVLRRMFPIPSEIDLASDLAMSLMATDSLGVIFEGNEPVMNYHLHGGNSVFSIAAMGGLMSDLTNTRLKYLSTHPGILNKNRKKLLTRAVVISKVTTNAFNMTEKYGYLTKSIVAVRLSTGLIPIYWPGRIPIRLGPLKPLARWFIIRRLRK